MLVEIKSSWTEGISIPASGLRVSKRFRQPGNYRRVWGEGELEEWRKSLGEAYLPEALLPAIKGFKASGGNFL